MAAFQSNNLIYVHKIGENGAVLTAHLSDRDGFVTLTGWTVTLNVSRGATLLVDDAPCVPDPDQTTNKGKLTCTINNPAFAALTRVEELNGEFKLVQGPTTLYFPKSPDNKRTYFTFEVQKSLG